MIRVSRSCSAFSIFCSARSAFVSKKSLYASRVRIEKLFRVLCVCDDLTTIGGFFGAKCFILDEKLALADGHLPPGRHILTYSKCERSIENAFCGRQNAFSVASPPGHHILTYAIILTTFFFFCSTKSLAHNDLYFICDDLFFFLGPRLTEKYLVTLV